MQARGQTQWGPEGLGARRVGARRVGARRVGARRVGARRVGARRVGARRVEARRVGGPKFRAFFSLSRHKFRSFLLSGGLLVEFWWCLKRRGAQMCTFGVLRLSCEAPAAPGAAGVSHDNQRAQTCTFERPGASKNTTKIQREDTQRGKKRTKFVAGEGKKRAKFWAVQGKDGPRKGGEKQTLKPTPHT